MRRAVLLISAAGLLSSLTSGCIKGGAAEPFGKTFYLGGASNIDLLTSGVTGGLRQAGYRGDVESYIWTISFNPLVDQLLTVNAKARASLLARHIERYRQRYPDTKINIIALSAGTGVAVWAVEDLKRSTRINNVILLGSSLSASYDVRRALRNMDGNFYVYHSPHDAVLEAVELVGTIDGKRGVSSAGQIGLRKPAGHADRIVNVPWTRKYMRYGWAGGHTDCINETFIRAVVGPLIVDRPATPESGTRLATGQSRPVSTSDSSPDRVP